METTLNSLKKKLEEKLGDPMESLESATRFFLFHIILEDLQKHIKGDWDPANKMNPALYGIALKWFGEPAVKEISFLAESLILEFLLDIKKAKEQKDESGLN